MLIKQINPKSSKSSALLISDCVGLCGGKVEPCSYTLELPVDSIVNSISIKDLNGDIYSIIGLNIQAPFKRLPREIYKLAYTLGFIATKQNWFSLAYSQDTSIFQFSCLSEAVLVSVTTSTGDIPFIKKCSPLDPEASFDFRVRTTYSGHFLIDGIPLFNFAYDDWISESPRLFVCDVVIRSIDGTVQTFRSSYIYALEVLSLIFQTQAHNGLPFHMMVLPFLIQYISLQLYRCPSLPSPFFVTLKMFL